MSRRDDPPGPAGGPAGHPPEQLPGPRLSKDQRKNLLAHLEASTSRSESPDRLLARAHEALSDGRISQARRIYEHLLTAQLPVSGLDLLRDQLMTSEQNAKQGANVQRAVDMLTQAIQQRKKTLAQMALETLRELAPDHPQAAEYEIWVRDLDQEVALQERVDTMLAIGREALHAGDTTTARQQIEALRSLDPWSHAIDELAQEIEDTERGAQASAGIGKLKQQIQQALDRQDAGAAQRGLEQLGSMDVPKITLDFYAKRIRDLRQKLQDESEASGMEKRFHEALNARDYPRAREIAREYGRRFADDSHGTDLFNRVAEVEAGERRRASIEQGIQQVQRFIAAGDKAQADMALRVIKGMGPDAAKVAELEAKIRSM